MTFETGTSTSGRRYAEVPNGAAGTIQLWEPMPGETRLTVHTGGLAMLVEADDILVRQDGPTMEVVEFGDPSVWLRLFDGDGDVWREALAWVCVEMDVIPA